MAKNEEVNGDTQAGGTFSQLLFSVDDDVGFNADGCFNYTPTFSSVNCSKMICFGDCKKESDLGLAAQTTKTPQKSGVTCSDSSSVSSTNNSNTISIPQPNKKRNIFGNESSWSSGSRSPVDEKRNCKKTKAENSSATGHAKGKRQKLGESISALQQLVSPFGKTDTASVLHEAMGYIRFLHDQVQVLCSPYLQCLPSSSAHLHDGGEKGEGEVRKDLRSTGLCLVPIQCALPVAESNGADFWSPVTNKNIS